MSGGSLRSGGGVTLGPGRSVVTLGTHGSAAVGWAEGPPSEAASRCALSGRPKGPSASGPTASRLRFPLSVAFEASAESIARLQLCLDTGTWRFVT